ncbi:hypothetical protein BDV27DRAFT_152980 [Aspergillus caelatus]|uniref:Uncharacterized protein n=2 Tax=Aspergillus subgen. Circumdati TaxID=2720871 RepID=A0A5N7AHX8_9EURO|nr:uncharacterized protein BDV27DRAFT_152980 [Aspergillus caelatus]KAE8369484.1 hypothetical protein BDV27DRAFT_152980 [Aspergillus caelatus]KAE8417146.1 hypothetical protein BDV36DRAFT_296460 [Aspergillus pseudocaelatus]
MRGDPCYIRAQKVEWHRTTTQVGSDFYWTAGDEGIGTLTVEPQGSDPTPWVYAKPDKNVALKLDVEIHQDGFILRDIDSGMTVSRSGDWVILKHAENPDDAMLQWSRISRQTYWARFKSGGDWLRTNESGELNVKGSGEYAILMHNSFWHLPH